MSKPVKPVCATGSAFDPVELDIVTPLASRAGAKGCWPMPELVKCIHLRLFDPMTAAPYAA